MSLFTEAQVTILLADYAGNDAAGKLNVVGGNIRFIGQQSPGASVPFCLVVQVDIPAKYAGTEFALGIEVQDATAGRPVSIPGPDGQLQPLRAQQVVTVPALQVAPNLIRPADGFTSSSVIMNFSGGLPLQAGHSYDARVQIDGQSRHWFYRFHVLAPQPGMVFGGPMNSPTIPGVGEYTVDPPSDSGDAPPESAPPDTATDPSSDA
jgi:hypothetical protein